MYPSFDLFVYYTYWRLSTKSDSKRTSSSLEGDTPEGFAFPSLRPQVFHPESERSYPTVEQQIHRLEYYQRYTRAWVRRQLVRSNPRNRDETVRLLQSITQHIELRVRQAYRLDLETEQRLRSTLAQQRNIVVTSLTQDRSSSVSLERQRSPDWETTDTSEERRERLPRRRRRHVDPDDSDISVTGLEQNVVGRVLDAAVLWTRPLGRVALPRTIRRRTNHQNLQAIYAAQEGVAEQRRDPIISFVPALELRHKDYADLGCPITWLDALRAEVQIDYHPDGRIQEITCKNPRERRSHT